MKKKLILILSLATSVSYALVYESQYKPLTYNHPETRIERPWLASFTLAVLGGNTFCGNNCAGNTQPLGQWFSQCGLPRRVNEFRIVDLELEWIQNLNKGFFVYALGVPARSIELKYHHRKVEKKNHPSDTYVSLGWTKNHLGTCYLDFVDITCMIGVLIPTSNRACIRDAIPVSTGFNHHWGGTASFALALGLFDWFTWGVFSEGLFFEKNNYFYSPGTVWKAGSYIKADHIFRGISLYMGYRFEEKRSDKFPLRSSACCFQAQSDRQVFDIFVEWDGQTFEHPHRPRLQFFYNHTITGKNILNTSLLGASLGFEVVWRC